MSKARNKNRFLKAQHTNTDLTKKKKLKRSSTNTKNIFSIFFLKLYKLSFTFFFFFYLFFKQCNFIFSHNITEDELF